MEPRASISDNVAVNIDAGSQPELNVAFPSTGSVPRTHDTGLVPRVGAGSGPRTSNPIMQIDDKPVLVIENRQGHSQTFTDLNAKTVRHAPREVNPALTNNISRSIKQSEFSAVWAELPIPGLHCAPHKYPALMAQLCAWVVLAVAVGMPFVVFGSAGVKWQEPHLQALIADGTLRLAHHRLCHFGLKVDPTHDKPSGSMFCTASTFSMRGHPCKCKVSQDQHVEDFNKTNKLSLIHI